MTTDLIPQQPGAIQEAIDPARFVDAWLQHEKTEGASDATLATYEHNLAVFLDWLDGRTVTPAEINEFKAGQAVYYSVQTVNLRLSAIRSFYRYLASEQGLVYNPAAGVKGLKRTKSRQHKRDELTSGEVLAVLGSCDLSTTAGIRDRAILGLMAYCGLRAVEVHRADVDDLRTRQDRLTLDIQGKGRIEKDEWVVLPRKEETHLRAWLAERQTVADGPALFVSLSQRSRGQRLTTSGIRHLVKGRMQAAGVAKVRTPGDPNPDRKTTHSMRHSAITAAIRGGASPLQVQAMARHSSFDTTLAYIHEVGRLDNPAEDLINYGESQPNSNP